MNGLELSRNFYEQEGKPMLESKFKEIMPFIAIGLTGSGSECYGFDDDISRDHDFEAGFCIFLPEENVIDRRTEFQLERAYATLPKEYMGVKRSVLNAVGGNRHGIIRTADFFEAKVGEKSGELSQNAWLNIPEYALAEAVNGEIFFDDYGAFTAIRNKLKNMPEDVRLKRLAGSLLVMGQAGQYNYMRCISRNETAAAQLSIIEFVKNAMKVVFLLNKVYMPYYKWSFRAMRDLPLLSYLSSDLEYLISSSNTIDEAMEKSKKIELICSAIANEMKSQGLNSYIGSELEGIAYHVNGLIKNGDIRNLHILYSV